MSARSIATVTGFGPRAERILATSSSRKDWGLSPPACRPSRLLSAMTDESPRNDYTAITHFGRILLDVFAKRWLMCRCANEQHIPQDQDTKHESDEEQKSPRYWR